jgi:hypothetical protein
MATYVTKRPEAAAATATLIELAGSTGSGARI